MTNTQELKRYTEGFADGEFIGLVEHTSGEWIKAVDLNRIKADAVREALAYARKKCDWSANTFYKTVEFSRAAEEYADQIKRDCDSTSSSGREDK